VLVPWYVYRATGDLRFLGEHYEGMKRYVEFLRGEADGLILPRDNYGDHSTPITSPSYERGDPEMSSTWYLLYNTLVLARAAELLARPDDAREHEARAEEIRRALHERFYLPERAAYDDCSQCAMIMALYLDVPPPAERPKVLHGLIQGIDHWCKGRLVAGILGTRYAMELLTREGFHDTAWRLATSTDYPSWGYMTQGRTTLSECWDRYRGSNNHVMFGSIDTWFYRALAGINIDQAHPGYANFVIKPCIQPGLSWVKASVETVRGRIVTEWACRDGEYRLGVTIPANSTATVYVMSQDGEKVTESGRAAGTSPGVRYLGSDKEHAIFEVGSGTYEFVSRDV